MKNRPKQAASQKSKHKISESMHRRMIEGVFLFAIAVALFLLISLLTYHSTDPGWSSTGVGHVISNSGGRVGAFLSDVMLSSFGLIAYGIPIALLWVVRSLFASLNQPASRYSHDAFYQLVGWVILIGSACALVSFHQLSFIPLPAHTGGIIGEMIRAYFTRLFSQTGTALFLIANLFAGLTLVTGLSWLKCADKVGECSLKCWASLRVKYQAYRDAVLERKKQQDALLALQALDRVKSISHEKEVTSSLVIESKREKTAKVEQVERALIVMPKASKESLPERQPSPKSSVSLSVEPLPPGSLPSSEWLSPSEETHDKPFQDISLEELSRLVERRLADFGVEVQVVAVHPGPIITRLELDLAPGIKVSKITSLAKDIARSLSTVSVRIVEVIPGKSVIGLEIPNQFRERVSLRELIESSRYRQSRSPLSLVLGKDTSGAPMVVDLVKMPHLLVAGTTGSGKSVSLNVMILSLLFKALPSELRLIMIDPKMLELSVYDGIPHLLTPVITDMKDAANALRWCVTEMDKRYQLMAALGVRNLAGYNQKIEEAAQAGEPIYMPGVLVKDEASAKMTLSALPMVVVIVDEFADMMMVVGKKVEDLIARIAQKARAAGIHLILATQRPSVDVITGLIKANIPTRIAFQVSSRIDSRTILDQQGAEQLLGHGDMLYLPPGVGVPVRVHGAFVSDDEVHRVVAALRSQGEPTYLDEITTTEEEDLAGGAIEPKSGSSDPMYDEAVKIVLASKRASISLIQRRLRIGYNRAARLMEEMEASGLVSTMDHSGSREVLVTTSIDND